MRLDQVFPGLPGERLSRMEAFDRWDEFVAAVARRPAL
jgi:hypothetical protein